MTRSLPLALLLVACQAPSPAPRACSPDGPPARFDRSPGGVPEVAPSWVLAHHCQVRLVDVRSEEELTGPLGRIPWARHVPLDRLEDEAEAWDRDAPVVLVCRSGRRSARATRALEDLGFGAVASMTGGMLAWRDGDRPVVRHRASPAPPPPAEPHAGPLRAVDIETHLGDPRRIRWVKVAALLMQGTQSCVDGRDPRPVLGTPGGDAGEILLSLAAAERVRGAPFPASRVGPFLDAYLDAFGRVYVHTDTHALEALEASLRDDPRFAPALARGVERLVRRPPRALEGPLLDALTRPAHVGCGHLRLMREHPDEYGVRPALSEAVLRAIFVRLWRGDAIDFVVLEGGHAEGAVLDVVLDGEVHSYTRVPMIAPHLGDRELFVHHPQVSAWLREQNASFVFEHDPALRAEPGRREALHAELERLGAAQLQATLSHLAADLPRYRAHVSERRVSIEAAR